MKKTKRQKTKAAGARVETKVSRALKSVAVKRKSRKRSLVEKRPPGRPTVCTDDAALIVLLRIMEGDSLDKACEPEDVPCKRTWLRWVAANVNLQGRYVAAMQIRALSLAEDCVPLADGVIADKEAVAKARLQINTRQWMIMRLANKVYGKDGVVIPPPQNSEQSVMSDPEIELRLKSLRDDVKGKR